MEYSKNVENIQTELERAKLIKFTRDIKKTYKEMESVIHSHGFELNVEDFLLLRASIIKEVEKFQKQ